MAIKFESKKEAGDARPRKAPQTKERVEASVEEAGKAANAPEMPFAKPVRPPKKGFRK